jgi:hypothetical protein
LVSRPDPARLLVQLETLAGLMAGRDGATAGLPGPAAWYEATTGRRLDPWQCAVVESDAGRMLLVCGRQCGKTEVVSASAAYRALFLGRRVGILSPTYRQSLLVFRRTRGLLLAANATIARDIVGSIDLPHGGRIVAFPGDDPDKSVRGETLSDLIIDEAALIRDDVIVAATPTLATVADHREIHLGTPKGQRGEFYRQWSGGEGWERHSVRSDQCPRISAEFLARMKSRLGPSVFDQEFCCKFLVSPGGVLDPERLDAIFGTDISPDAWAPRLTSEVAQSW